MSRHLLWITVAMLAVGCATDEVRLSELSLTVPECDILVIPPNCRNPVGTPNAPVVNFNTNGMTVAPRNVCAKLNATLEFRLTPVNPGGNPRPIGSVSLVAKDLSNTWLVGTNSPVRDKISIVIPDHVDEDEYYAYTLFVSDDSGVRCVDPRVHVEN